jgi:hypothetical protein
MKNDKLPAFAGDSEPVAVDRDDRTCSTADTDRHLRTEPM